MRDGEPRHAARRLESSKCVIENDPAWRFALRHHHPHRTQTTLGEPHMNPLDTLKGTVIAGVVLAVVLAFVATKLAGG